MAGRGLRSATLVERGAGRKAGARAARRRVAVALVACAALPSLGRAARADELPTRAELLFREGREAMKRGDLDAACPKFAESQGLDPSPGTLLNLALCEQRKGEGARAWAHFRELVDTLPPSDERAAIARARVETLSLRLARLRVRLAPEASAGTKVWLDGLELDAAHLGVEFLIDPGAHAIIVHAPDRVERRYHVEAEAGQSASLTVAPSATLLVPPPVGVPAPRPSFLPAPPVRTRAPKLDSLSWEQRSGYTLLVFGGVSVAVGAISGFFAVQQTRQAELYCGNVSCSAASRRDRENAKTFTLVSALTAGGGLVVGTVGGIVLWQTTPKQRVATLSPLVTQRGGGLSWRVDF